MTDPSVELALAELSRKIDVGFTKTDGQLALLLQRTEAMERRADQQARDLESLESRLGKVERTAVTRSDMDKRTQRIIAIVAVLVAAAGIILGVITKGG